MSNVGVVNQLLTEMDGFDKRKQVYLLAATNRPDNIDEAVLRPGRLDKMLWLDLPDVHGRLKILEIFAKNTPLASDVSLEDLAQRTERFR